MGSTAAFLAVINKNLEKQPKQKQQQSQSLLPIKKRGVSHWGGWRKEAGTQPWKSRRQSEPATPGSVSGTSDGHAHSYWHTFNDGYALLYEHTRHAHCGVSQQVPWWYRHHQHWWHPSLVRRLGGSFPWSDDSGVELTVINKMPGDSRTMIDISFSGSDGFWFSEDVTDWVKSLNGTTLRNSGFCKSQLR